MLTKTASKGDGARMSDTTQVPTDQMTEDPTADEAGIDNLAAVLPTQPASRYDDDVVKALERLRAQGVSFNDMTVTMLAKEVGISRVTFYSHYGDKRRVIAMLAERTAGQIAREVDVWYRFAERLTFDELREVQDRILDIMETHRTTMDLLIETSTYDEEIGKFYVELKGTIGDMLGQVIDKLRAAGRCDPGLDASFGIVLANMFERNYYYFAAAPGRPRDQKILDWMTETYWRLLYCKHVPTDPSAP